ncbi:MAG: hypothetical protein ACMZ64_03490 [Oleiphilus sp.]
MQIQSNAHKPNRLQILKNLYLGKSKQLSETNASLNCLKYQFLQAELLVLKAAIPEDELP